MRVCARNISGICTRKCEDRDRLEATTELSRRKRRKKTFSKFTPNFFRYFSFEVFCLREDDYSTDENLSGNSFKNKCFFFPNVKK